MHTSLMSTVTKIVILERHVVEQISLTSVLQTNFSSLLIREKERRPMSQNSAPEHSELTFTLYSIGHNCAERVLTRAGVI